MEHFTLEVTSGGGKPQGAEPLEVSLLQTSSLPEPRLGGLGKGKHRPEGGGGCGGAKAASCHKDVSRFKSSDGLVILRGRNANGNRALLKIASPHDYWFHSQNGPSAHTVLRRAHALVEAPEASLLEAAGLTALKSAWKNDSRAEIIMALVRDVRPLKGGAPGQVLVDKILRTLVVRPDAELEKLAEEPL